MKTLCITLNDDKVEFIDRISKLDDRLNKSATIELIIDAAMGNLGVHLIGHHFRNGFDRPDGRKKERVH